MSSILSKAIHDFLQDRCTNSNQNKSPLNPIQVQAEIFYTPFFYLSQNGLYKFLEFDITVSVFNDKCLILKLLWVQKLLQFRPHNIIEISNTVTIKLVTILKGS